MRMFDLARRPPHWLRVALAALLLAFALNSIAHVTHRHEAAQTSVAHSVACGYCVSFGGLADAPRHCHPVATAEQFSVFVAPALDRVFSSRSSTSAQPRAPPRR